MKKSRYSMQARCQRASSAAHGTLRRFEKGGVYLGPEQMKKAADRHRKPQNSD